MYLVMDYHEENRLFRSPIGPNPQVRIIERHQMDGERVESNGNK